VSRVNGILGVSRALGDFDLEPLVNSEPEIFSFPLNDEKRFKFMICACDGLWDVVRRTHLLSCCQFVVR
jgi:serine/threonine protein phosphatase PrpC